MFWESYHSRENFRIREKKGTGIFPFFVSPLTTNRCIPLARIKSLYEKMTWISTATTLPCWPTFSNATCDQDPGAAPTSSTTCPANSCLDSVTLLSRVLNMSIYFKSFKHRELFLSVSFSWNLRDRFHEKECFCRVIDDSREKQDLVFLKSSTLNEWTNGKV